MRITAFCFAIFITVLVLASCTARDKAYYEDYEPAANVAPVEKTPSPEAPENNADVSPSLSSAPSPTPAPNIVEWSCPSHNLMPITGTIISFYGPVAEDGTVPWDVEWVQIEIEKTDGTPAIVVGMHSTGFFFGRMPAPGMEITAYIAHEPSLFLNDPPLYIATAIIGDAQAGQGIAICCEAAQLAFIVTDETSVTHSDLQQRWNLSWSLPHNCAERVTQLLANRPLAWDSHLVIVYDAILDELPIARDVVILYNSVPFPNWVEPINSPITLNFIEYIFPANAFETLDLPIYVDGSKIDAPSPLLTADGTILVPFREIFANGIGFGNYAYIGADGSLGFGGGGGGSESSAWAVGHPYVAGIGWRMPICTPPVIVGGVIYVPLITGIGHGAPFASVWLFDDSIHAFNTDRLPYGPWHSLIWNTDLMTDEELAAHSILVNGIEIESPPAIFWVVPYADTHWRSDVMVSLAAVAKALDCCIIQDEAGSYFMNFMSDIAGGSFPLAVVEVDGGNYMLLRARLGIRSIIYNGQILIVCAC